MKTFSQHLDIIFVTIVCAVPVSLWFMFNFTPNQSFTSPGNIFKSLGQLFAIVGGALFCLNFILSARFSLIESIFNGLNRVYIWHHLLGAASFILLLFHPLFLGLQYLFISINLVFSFFLPSIDDYFMWFGTISLAIVISLLVITFFANLKYNTWKFTHQFLGIGLGFAFLHMLFSKGELSSNFLLHSYLVILGIIALYSYFYRKFLSRIINKKYPYIITKVAPRGDETMEITLSPKSKKLKFDPGQFVFTKISSLNIIPEEHPFSITSSPLEESIRLGIKALGDYTETIKLVKVNDLIELEGPYGRFSYLNTLNKKQVWIAGGIGITPFVSMAKDISLKGGYDIILYYVTSTKDQAVFLGELAETVNVNKSLKIISYVTQKNGHLTADIIATKTNDLEKRDIFLCGPPLMMKSLKHQFNSLGIKNSKIHSEEFNLL